MNIVAASEESEGPMSTPPAYDPRYLAGIVLFNRQDYFEAHEVWEQLWLTCDGPDKRFYQGLIQAAVALCHFCNGNVRGALKLYHSSREYLGRYLPRYAGLNVEDFCAQMARCFAPLLAQPDPPLGLTPEEALLPQLSLDPAPAAWPDPAAFLPSGEEDKQEN